MKNRSTKSPSQPQFWQKLMKIGCSSKFSSHSMNIFHNNEFCWSKNIVSFCLRCDVMKFEVNWLRFSTFYLKNQGFGYFEEYLAPFGTVNLIWQHFSPQKVINFFLRYHVMKFEVDWLRFSLFSRGGGSRSPPQSWQGLSDVSLIRVKPLWDMHQNCKK